MDKVEPSQWSTTLSSHTHMASITKEVERELIPFVRLYKDGSVERLGNSPYVPPSPQDKETGVSSKDITISQDPSISARLYLPKLNQPHHQKLPILIYFHGGGFCIESAFSSDHQRYLNSLVSQAQVVAVSVEYRLAPEHLLPIAYEDSWAALQWVASHFIDDNVANKEPWLINHGDFNRVFLGGDSAGANIVHNIALRAGVEGLHGGVRITGAFLTHPFFWGLKPVGSEYTAEREKGLAYSIWNLVYPSAPGGIDNPMINPFSPGAPSLAGLGCSRLLVTVSEKDRLRDRGIMYYNAVKESEWKGEVELIEVQGEGHAFQILDCGTENANNLTKRLASFLLK